MFPLATLLSGGQRIIKKLFPPIESLTKLYRGQPPYRNADCSAGAEPLVYLAYLLKIVNIDFTFCQIYKNRLTNFKRLCII